MTTSQEFTSVEALREQCTRIMRLASEALRAAIERREALRAQVGLQQQSLAAMSAQCQVAETSLAAVREQVARLTREVALRRAEETPPPVVVPLSSTPLVSSPPSISNSPAAVSSAAAAPAAPPIARPASPISAELLAALMAGVSDEPPPPAQAPAADLAPPLAPAIEVLVTSGSRTSSAAGDASSAPAGSPGSAPGARLNDTLGSVRRAARRLPQGVPRAGLIRHVPTALLSVLLLGLAVLLTPVSQLLGWEIFAVLSGSMEPTIKVGGIVAVHPVPADQLKVGDVITFVDQNRPDTFVTHRIVELSFNDGQAQAKTKGDANDTADAWSVPMSKAVGRVDLALPYVGFLMVWLSSPLAKVAILGIAVLGLAVPSVRRNGSAAAPGTPFESAQPRFEPSQPLAAVPPAAVPLVAPPAAALVDASAPAASSSFEELEREIAQMLSDGVAEARRAA